MASRPPAPGDHVYVFGESSRPVPMEWKSSRRFRTIGPCGGVHGTRDMYKGWTDPENDERGLARTGERTYVVFLARALPQARDLLSRKGVALTGTTDHPLWVPAADFDGPDGNTYLVIERGSRT